MDELNTTLTGAGENQTTVPPNDEALKTAQANIEKLARELDEEKRVRGNLLNQVNTQKRMLESMQTQQTAPSPYYTPPVQQQPVNDDRTDAELQGMRFQMFCNQMGMPVDMTDKHTILCVSEASTMAEAKLAGEGLNPNNRHHEGLYFQTVLENLKSDSAYMAITNARKPKDDKPNTPTEVTATSSAGAQALVTGETNAPSREAQERIKKINDTVLNRAGTPARRSV